MKTSSEDTSLSRGSLASWLSRPARRGERIFGDLPPLSGRRSALLETLALVLADHRLRLRRIEGLLGREHGAVALGCGHRLRSRGVGPRKPLAGRPALLLHHLGIGHARVLGSASGRTRRGEERFRAAARRQSIGSISLGIFFAANQQSFV